MGIQELQALPAVKLARAKNAEADVILAPWFVDDSEVNSTGLHTKVEQWGFGY